MSQSPAIDAVRRLEEALEGFMSWFSLSHVEDLTPEQAATLQGLWIQGARARGIDVTGAACADRPYTDSADSQV